MILEDIGKHKDDVGELAAHVAGGARLKSYRFDKYRTKEDKDAKPKLKTLVIQYQETSRRRPSLMRT